ncbi:unnamed protein product, partial [Amoebophrya sp. A25]
SSLFALAKAAIPVSAASAERGGAASRRQRDGFEGRDELPGSRVPDFFRLIVDKYADSYHDLASDAVGGRNYESLRHDDVFLDSLAERIATKLFFEKINHEHQG